MSIGIVYLQGSVSGEVVSKATLCALTAARQYGAAIGVSEFVGLSIGPRARDRAESVQAYGLKEIYVVDDSDLAALEVVSVVHAIKTVIRSLQHSDVVFVCPATSHGKDIAPRIAVALEAGQASDITEVRSDGTLVRPMYAGDILATVSISSRSKVLTVRASSFSPAEPAGGASPVKVVAVDSYPAYKGIVVKQSERVVGRPELADAEIVVSGGRALQSAENFEKVIFPLADKLGAAVGASRAAVDAGYAPNDWQVGQTGKVVAPKLYIAVGISGAIQHAAGMKGAKVIVAINKDAEAPIFEIADYGLVMDLYEAVPKLTELLG